MGFLDDLNAVFNRGTEAAGRIADTANYKIKLATLDSRYKDLAAQLGETVFERVVKDPALSEGVEHLLTEMASISNERNQLRAEIERIEHEVAHAKASAVVYVCPSCGASVQSSARFCPSCGIQLGQAPNAHCPEHPPVYTQVDAAAQSQYPESAPSASPVVTQTYEVPGTDSENR